jgi:hypothetical protein
VSEAATRIGVCRASLAGLEGADQEAESRPASALVLSVSRAQRSSGNSWQHNADAVAVARAAAGAVDQTCCWWPAQVLAPCT